MERRARKKKRKERLVSSLNESDIFIWRYLGQTSLGRRTVFPGAPGRHIAGKRPLRDPRYKRLYNNKSVDRCLNKDNVSVWAPFSANPLRSSSQVKRILDGLLLATRRGIRKAGHGCTQSQLNGLVWIEMGWITA